MSPYDIVKTVRVTEKGTRQADLYNQYTLVVDPRATKPEIKAAVQFLFQVHVVAVRTMHVRGKLRRQGRKDAGSTSAWKKAIVQLKKGERINLA
ncbi:MAG: 50S ribosomal protein L23 [Verrucomicrobia bacterium]|nr:50S ribosomal protein L23 [Verrucomicrobiota bacterium]